MAQERYGFFNSTAEDERSYDSADMAAALRTLASSGVAAADTCLRVTAEGSTMRTLVGYGSAMLNGYYYRLRDDGSGIRAFEHTTEAELNRIDRIILRLDLSARTVAMVKLIGTAASTPAAPALTRNDTTYEISLARVLVQAAATEILPADITDERGDDTVCGLIAPESLRRSSIVQLIDDAVGDAMDTLDDVLRVSKQTLESSEQARARGNIAAQRAITASGILKGNGTAVSAAAAGTDYALPVTEAFATLSASAWIGTKAPYTQNISVAGMTASTAGVSIGLRDTATDAQYEAALEALLRASAQNTGSITVRALGEKPAVDLPVLIRIVG